MTWDEDRLHRWLARRGSPRGVVVAFPHDAAVLRALRGRPVVCTDQTLAGVHFAAGTGGRAAGRKACARALSDLAATAAVPRGVLLALRAPPECPEAWIRAAIEGVRERARRHGCDLVGGDLACGPGPAGLSVTALGDLPGRRPPPARGRARAGQVVLLTGPVGGSGLGRHLRFEPRIAAGRALFDAGATALMDVSDGLAWDLHRLARTAGVRIDLERVPLHPDARRAARRDGRDALWHALHDGEDHELLACLAPSAAERALAADRSLVRIGRVRRGSGLWLSAAYDEEPRQGAKGRHVAILAAAGRDQRRWKPSEGGWRHGGGDA